MKTYRKSNKKQSITIDIVAEKAGVSTATVSRVLNKKGNVSEKVSQKVSNAIKELNYRPNRAAYHLRSGKGKRIGVLFADIQNPFFTSVLAGIENLLYQSGYTLLVGNSNEDPKREKIQLESLIDEGVAGIIVASVSKNFDRFKQAINYGIPILALDRIMDGISVDTVTINNIQAAQDATNYLIRLGHKKIAFISGPNNVSTSNLRRTGYEQAIEEISGLNKIIELGNFRQDGGYNAMIKLLSQEIKPTAVLVANNLMTLGALQALIEKKVKIPEEMSLLGFDDMPWSSSLQPPLTVVAQPTYNMGRIAAKLIIDRIQDPIAPAQQISLETNLIIRNSCKRID